MELAEHNLISAVSSHMKEAPLLQTGILFTQIGSVEGSGFPHLAIVIFLVEELRQIGSESLLVAVQSLIAPASQIGERAVLPQRVIPSWQ